MFQLIDVVAINHLIDNTAAIAVNFSSTNFLKDLFRIIELYSNNSISRSASPEIVKN